MGKSRLAPSSCAASSSAPAGVDLGRARRLAARRLDVRTCSPRRSAARSGSPAASRSRAPGPDPRARGASTCPRPSSSGWRSSWARSSARRSPGDEGSAALRAARQDAQLMSEQMRRAWEDFLEAEAAVHPVLLVLEDLHWGDLATVQFIDAALRDRCDQPWMVLALARPEVHEVFPRLWAERQNVQEIRLKELGRKAGERLVRQVLGDARRRRDAGAPGQAGRRQRVLPRGADPRGGRGQGRRPAGDGARDGRDPARPAPDRGPARAARRQRVRRGVLAGRRGQPAGRRPWGRRWSASGSRGWWSRRCSRCGRPAGSPASGSSCSGTRCSARAPTRR